MEVPSCLPIKILVKIFAYLNLRDQRVLRFVCRDFKALIDNELKFMEKCSLKITANNLSTIRNQMENQIIDKNKFNDVQLIEIADTRIEDLKYIFENIGENIQHLKMQNTRAFKHFMDYVNNLQTLNLHFSKCDPLINYLYLYVCDLEFLEHFQTRYVCRRSMNCFLLQLKGKPGKLLKSLRLHAVMDALPILEVLRLHTTIEFLTLALFIPYEAKNARFWKEVFENLRNLRKLRIFCTPRNIYLSENLPHEILGNLPQEIFENLPQEAPLEEVVLFEATTIQLPLLIVHKWQKTLKFLFLWDCQVNDEFFMALENLHKLRVFKICTLKEEINILALTNGLAAQENLMLEELHIIYMGMSTAIALNDMLSHLPNLRVLALYRYPSKFTVTNSTLDCIVRHQKRLRILKMRFTADNIHNNISDINGLHELEELNLHYCPKMTDDILTILILPKLRKLKLYECHKLTISGIEKLVKYFPLLETLGINGEIIHEYPEVVEVLENGLKFLRNLHIWFLHITGKSEREQVQQSFKTFRSGIFIEFVYK